MSNSTILKESTKDLHDNVERVMNSSLLFSNQFTTQHYTSFIVKSYEYVFVITDSVQKNWPEYAAVLLSKKGALLHDLEHLSAEPNVNTLKKIDETDKYYQLGLIYIVLGAMLGNKVIWNKLKSNPAFSDFPFNYLSHHQEDLSTLWKNFQDQVNALSSTQLNQVIQGAKKGYSLFGE